MFYEFACAALRAGKFNSRTLCGTRTRARASGNTIVVRVARTRPGKQSRRSERSRVTASSGRDRAPAVLDKYTRVSRRRRRRDPTDFPDAATLRETRRRTTHVRTYYAARAETEFSVSVYFDRVSAVA